MGIPNRPELENIQGTAGNDRIEIANAGIIVRVNVDQPGQGWIQYVPHPRQNIQVFAVAGEDVVTNRTSSSVEIWGGDGNDTLTGGSGHDSLFGEQGNDVLIDREGDDLLWGYLGDDRDVIQASARGTKSISDLEGANTLDFSNLDRAISIDIGIAGTQTVASNSLSISLSNDRAVSHVRGTVFDDRIFGNALNNDLFGDAGNDQVWGRGGNDSINGHSGNNLLYGEDGNDSIYGEDGDDTLDGGIGNDLIVGGNGLDKSYSSGRDRSDDRDALYRGAQGINRASSFFDEAREYKRWAQAFLNALLSALGNG